MQNKFGITQVVKRYAIANNRYLDDYNPNQPNNYIIYADVNNLYGYAMNCFLPYSGFEWYNEDLDMLDVPDDSEVGYTYLM